MIFVSDLLKLTKHKEIVQIKSYLERLPKEVKGRVFEEYLVELFKGNGWLATRKGGRGDGGADILIFNPEAPNNVFFIIQAKNHNKPLSFDDTKIELVKFEDIASKKYNCNNYAMISINGFVKDAKKLEEFKMKLEAWDYVEKLITKYDPESNKKPEIELFAHNKIAYENIKKSWENSNRVAVVQATGTGKSYLIAKCLSDYVNQKKLVLAPSHYILNQIRNKFLWLEDNTFFMTYAKAMNLTENEISELGIEFLVLDEFHRIGAEKWGEGVNKILILYPNINTLGTSATPIRFLDGNRDMSDEFFENNVAINLSLTEAIVKDILPMPIYVSALYTLKEEIKIVEQKIESSENNTEEKQDLFTRIQKYDNDWEKSSGIPHILKKFINSNENKFIVFCKNKEHLEDMEWIVESWFKKAKFNKRVRKYRVMDGEKGNVFELEQFRTTKENEAIHLLFSIDMLNEGLHINDVHGVILLRPTESPTIFYQQIGRSIQTGKQTNPLIFDFVNNFSSIKSRDFLSDLNDAKEKENRKRKEFGLKENNNEFTVFDETKEVIELFETINNALKDSWENKYEELLNYKDKYGNCEVPQSFNKSLANWVTDQRKYYKKGLLIPERKEKLNKLGFIWDVLENYWSKMYEQLVEYYNKYGETIIKNNTKDYKNLLTWVKTQRGNHRRGSLSNEKIKKLEELNFVWDINEHFWNTMYEKLIEYKNEHGNCLVKKEFKDLYSWVGSQRVRYKNKTLSDDKKHKLNSIGFTWDTKDIFWDEMYNSLVEYKKEHGDCLVPLRYEKNKSLGNFVINQRVKYKKGVLKEKQIKKLNELSFEWDLLDKYWSKMYKELVNYKKTYGDCLVAVEHKELNTWVSTQRSNYNTNNLSKEKIQKLNDIGFVWKKFDHSWEKMYNYLLEYIEEYGDCLVPLRFKDKENLGLWVSKQRLDYSNENLPDYRKTRLNEIGFVWNVLEHEWQEMYEMFLEFKRKNGHCNVPQNYEDKGLAIWVSNQRSNYNRNELEKDRFEVLDKVGFIWNVFDYNWELMFHELKKIKISNSNPSINENDDLNKWISRQRNLYKNKKLSEKRINKLNEINFCWDPLEEQWRESYKELKIYLKENNDLMNIRNNNKELAEWVRGQKRLYNKGKLSQERKILLEELGIKFDN